MGFFDNLFKSMANASMSRFGIKRPRDALRVLDNIIKSGRDDMEKVKYAKPILMWLKRLSLSADSMSREANDVLDKIRESERFSEFLDEHNINI